MAATVNNYSAELSLTHDRLGFAFCVALALHAAFILGVSFNREDRSLAATKLEITLAQHRTKQEVKKADFLAQSNQQGSGTLEKAAMLTTRETADFHDTVIREVSQLQQRQSTEQKRAAATKTITTIANSREKSGKVKKLKTVEELDANLADEMTAYERNLEVASLEAKLDMQRHAYAKRPRIRRLTSVATKESDDALYLHNWRTKIESIGNQNYPSKARQQELYGDLRLVVSLLPNGDVLQVKVLKSSGHGILDEAAIRIVHLAAPYDQFPTKMRQSVDVLEIIRTWRFHKDHLSSSS
jgi:protein TonB